MSRRRSSDSDSPVHSDERGDTRAREDAHVRTEDAALSAGMLALIRREGPLTFRDWMTAALYDEHEGYYKRPDLERWGRTGDYRTSPERTPLFAATPPKPSTQSATSSTKSAQTRSRVPLNS